MEKDKLIKAIETTMLKDVRNGYENLPTKNTPLEGLGILEILNKSKEECKLFMIKNTKVRNAPSTEKEIDYILKVAYTNVYEEIFDDNTINKSSKSNFHSIFVGTIREYTLDEFDLFDEDDGKLYIINPIAGKYPINRIIFEDVASKNGLYLGKSYLINCTELDAQPYGDREFEFIAVKELTAIEVLSAVDKLGSAELIY